MSKLSNTLAEHTGNAGGRGLALLQFILGVFIASTMLSWFWSTAAVEVFDTPEIRFSDCLAGVLALIFLSYVCGAAFRFGLGCHAR